MITHFFGDGIENHCIYPSELFDARARGCLARTLCFFLYVFHISLNWADCVSVGLEIGGPKKNSRW